MYKFIKKICPQGLKNNPNKKMTNIKYITIHTTGNYSNGADSEANAIYVYNNSGGRQASWHYSVDDKEIYQSFEDNQACWHTGNRKGNDCSIGIEICVNDKNNFIKACENAAHLTATLLKKHNLSLDKVVQHNYWSGKDCPKELRNGLWGINWNEFIDKVKNYLNNELTANEAIEIICKKCNFNSPKYWKNLASDIPYFSDFVIGIAQNFK